MTRISRLAIGALTAGLVAFAPPASAQSAAAASDNPWRHGTTLSLFGGTATDSSESHGTFGGGFGWEINHWIELEGTGTWLVPRHGSDAFAAELKMMASLTRPTTVVPFLGAGIGMYRASFDTTSGPLPEFYQSRDGGAAAGSSQTFTDPSFVFSGGLDIFARGRLSIRPEISVRLATHSSSVYPVTMVTVRATYHFELHEAGGNR